MDDNQIKKKIANNLEDLNMFFEAIGFDKKTIEDHFQRLGKLIFISVGENLEKISAFKEKGPMPEMKSFEDFIKYYEQYTDRATIEKIIQEETYKTFAGYFKAISENLPK